MDLGSSEASSEAVFWGETSFSSAYGCEFCEVVGGADHGPFGFDLVDAAQEELAEASCLLDLAEDGLDDLLSQSIPASIACALELCAHSGDERAGSELPFCRGRPGAVLLPPGGDVALDPAADERAKIGLRAIARIGRCFIRVLPEIGFYSIEQWRKLRLIARRVGQRVRHDDLMGAIDGGLCVVALDEAVFGRHHAAVGIGEVALRLVARLCRDGLGLASRPALAAVVVRLRGSFGFGFGFGFQRGLGGTDLLEPLLFVGHPLGHLVATLRGSELTILSLVGLGGLSQPALDLR